MGGGEITCSSTPLMNTNIVAKHFGFHEVKVIPQASDLEELCTGIVDSPHFFFITFTCMSFLTNTMVEIINITESGIALGIEEDLIKGIINENLLLLEHILPSEELQNMLRDILKIVIEDLNNQDITHKRDKLLYLHEKFKNIEINTSIERIDIKSGLKKEHQFGFNNGVKFYGNKRPLL